jgi:hypothetical protein
MLGTFTGLYKFFLNALPLLFPYKPTYSETFGEVDDEEYPGATVDVSIPPTPLDPTSQPIDYLQVRGIVIFI